MTVQHVAERRKEHRCITTGVVELLPQGATLSIAGDVRDVSPNGLRVRHTCLRLQAGDLVRFHNRNETGVARVVWNDVRIGAVESGLRVLQLESGGAGPGSPTPISV